MAELLQGDLKKFCNHESTCIEVKVISVRGALHKCWPQNLHDKLINYLPITFMIKRAHDIFNTAFI